MGLYDKLQNAISAGMNTVDPLFGGLIPRRTYEETPVIKEKKVKRQVNESPSLPRAENPVRQTGLQKASTSLLKPSNPNADKNYVFDWTEQELGIERSKVDLARDQLKHRMSQDTAELSLDTREQDRKEANDRTTSAINREKTDIDHRKQALDEWKTQNPEGEIKESADGEIVVIDKRSGKTIKTGIKGNNLSEEKKLELAAKNAKDLENIRQKNREKLKATPSGDEKKINPSQQRTAEKDAASELLNNPNYAWLNPKGVVTMSDDGRVIIDRTKLKGSKIDVENSTKVLDQFEKDWKAKSNERMNKTFTASSGGDEIDLDDDETVEMIAPDGGKLMVPKSEVEATRAKGARLAGESAAPASGQKPIEVDDSIELLYNDQNKVVGARNRKTPKVP